jgi:DNA-binding beta-propeller fold protein YncE
VTRLAFITTVALAAFLIAAATALAAYQFETSWGAAGSSDGQFNNPAFLATGPDGSVYVSDTSNNRVQKFTPDGAFLLSFGTAGTGAGQFNGPTGIGVGPDGSVYVADSGNNRVQRFDANGGFLSQWGSPGAGDGQFNGPTGVGVGRDGSVYVGDAGNARVERFLADGTFFSSFGSGAGGFGQVQGVAVGPDGSVYVVDNAGARVERFDANGTFQSSWGSQGSGDGQFLNARGVAASPAGVYVADATQSRVQKFTTTGAFVDSLDAGSGDTQLATPTGVAISSAGQIYVVGNNRVSRYTETGGANLPPPETGTSANVQPVDGVVKVKTPGSNQFIVLQAGQQIPIGSIVDVTKGTVDLTTTADDTSTQTARFYAGVFKLTQPKAKNPVTELQLFGANFKSACTARGRRASESAGKKKVVRQLWGVGKGKFRTKGRYGSATVRGTQWLTQDRCDGTLIRVTEGSVTVRDIPKKKTVTVTAPRTYLANAPAPRGRR